MFLALKNGLGKLIVAAFKGLLDDFGGAAAAYSLRKLSSSYSGFGIKIRRSGDNAEANVALPVTADSAITVTFGTSSATTLNEFVTEGSNRDGFIVTWYDQSGNSNHATAPADTNEPQIVSAGSLLADGIDFDGIDDHLECTSALGITTDTSAFIVVKLDTTAGTQFIVDNRDGGGDGSIMYNSSGNFVHLFQSGNAQVSSSTNESLVIFEKSATEILVAVNDGTPTTTANTNSIDVTNAPKIGARSFLAPTSFVNGSVKEIVIYSSIQTANRSNIIDNINDHYSIF
jgi:hypothetical protein